MLTVFTQTLLPIFTIIALGYLLKARGLLGQDVNQAINKVVYYVAIPAMMVTKLSHMSFASSFEPSTFIAAIVALPIAWVLARLVAGHFIDSVGRRATFIQSCIHGNLGYMGYAVAYYALSEHAFTQALVLGGFIIIEQNVLAVLAFAAQGDRAGSRSHFMMIIRPIVENPVILSVLAGLLISLSGFKLPVPVFRTLSILAGMAFPMALLLIGAGLAFDQMLPAGRELLSSGLFKLVLLPLIGWLLLFALQVPRDSMLPVLILLACPPATVTYVFATSMNGDPELAAAVISSHTLLSALAYSVLFYLFAVG